MTKKRDKKLDVIIGRNVRIQRLAKGLTQTALANRIGVTFQQVQKYERGANRIGGGGLLRIAQALGVPATELFNGAEVTANDNRNILDLLVERKSVRLVQAFAQLRDEGLRLALVELVEGLARRN